MSLQRTGVEVAMPPFDLARPGKSGAVDIHPCGACPVRALTVCAALEEEELSRLADIVHTHRVEGNQTIFSEGDAASNMFNVTAGSAKIYKLLPDGRRQITGFLFSGDFLGLAVNDRYAYSAETVATTSICRFPRRKMDQLMDEFPKLQRRLFRLASNELAAAQDQMLLLGRKTAKEKIASFLVMLAQRAVRRGQRDNPVHVPMSRADIADYLGLTTETVSRTFTQLKSSGTIRLLEGGKVQITDTGKIYEMAEGG